MVLLSLCYHLLPDWVALARTGRHDETERPLEPEGFADGAARPRTEQNGSHLTVDQVTAVRLRPQGPILHSQQRRSLARLKAPGLQTGIVGSSSAPGTAWSPARDGARGIEKRASGPKLGLDRIQCRSIFIQLRNLPDTKPDNKTARASPRAPQGADPWRISSGHYDA